VAVLVAHGQEAAVQAAREPAHSYPVDLAPDRRARAAASVTTTVVLPGGTATRATAGRRHVATGTMPIGVHLVEGHHRSAPGVTSVTTRALRHAVPRRPETSSTDETPC